MCNAVENIFIFILYDIYSHIPITLDGLIFPLFFKKLIVQRIRVKSVSFRDLGTGGEMNYVFYKMCNLAKYLYMYITKYMRENERECTNVRRNCRENEREKGSKIGDPTTTC